MASDARILFFMIIVHLSYNTARAQANGPTHGRLTGVLSDGWRCARIVFASNNLGNDNRLEKKNAAGRRHDDRQHRVFDRNPGGLQGRTDGARLVNVDGILIVPVMPHMKCTPDLNWQSVRAQHHELAGQDIAWHVAGRNDGAQNQAGKRSQQKRPTEGSFATKVLRLCDHEPYIGLHIAAGFNA